MSNERRVLGKYSKMLNEKLSETKTIQDDLVKDQISYKSRCREKTLQASNSK